MALQLVKGKFAVLDRLSCVGYFVNIWVGSVFRWLSMVEVSGFAFLFQGIVAVGFLNSVVTLSLSLILAIAGWYYLLSMGDIMLSMKLFGVALTLVGLHFAVFMLYSVFVGASLYSIMSTEVWLVAVLGLGASMFLGAEKGKTRNSGTIQKAINILK